MFLVRIFVKFYNTENWTTPRSLKMMLPRVCLPAQHIEAKWLCQVSTMGNHSMITACTLPEFVPEELIDQMVVEFGLRLRKELVNLQKSSGLRLK